MDDTKYEFVLPDSPVPAFAPQGTIPGSMDYDIVTPDGQHQIVPSAQSQDVMTKAQQKLRGLQMLRKILSKQAQNARLADVQVAKKTKKRRAKNKLAKASRKRNR